MSIILNYTIQSTLDLTQSVFNLFAGVVVPLLCELESSEKFMCVEVKSVGPWESLTVEKPEKHILNQIYNMLYNYKTDSTYYVESNIVGRALYYIK